MDQGEFLSLLGRINTWKQRGKRAPHKPLLLLLALGRLVRGEKRLARYDREVSKPLTDLLRQFGPPRSVHHPEAPFDRLSRDRLWEVVTDTELASLRGRGGVTHRKLIDHAARGGFPDPIQQLLLDAPGLVAQAAQSLLDGHFAPSLHDSIRIAVGLTRPAEREVSSGARRPRDANFRHAVLTAYERRCAVCDFDIRIDDDLVGLDAAHIRWHAAGGPDDVRNGLALCILHHRTFDCGAIGLEGATEGFRLLVSDAVNGQSQAFRQLLDCSGRPIRHPQRAEQRPDTDFIDWHRREVFRGSPRDTGGSYSFDTEAPNRSTRSR